MPDSTRIQLEILPAKRKRAQVSYLDEYDELDELLGVPERSTLIPEREDDADDNDDGGAYGSRKLAESEEGLDAQKSEDLTIQSGQTSEAVPIHVVADTISHVKQCSETPADTRHLAGQAELRDLIYELALVDPNGISLVSKTKGYRRTVIRAAIPKYIHGRPRYNGPPRRIDQQSTQGEAIHNTLSPALLAVSKQIHSEGLGYLYRQAIVLDDTYALHSFLSVVGSNRSMITDLTVKGWGTGRGTNFAMNFCAFPLLGLCTNLQSLFIDCSINWRSNPRALARQMFRDGHHFFEAYGAVNGSKDAAVDILQLNESNYDCNTGYGYRIRNEPLLEKDDFKEQFQTELRKLLGC